MTSIKKVLKVAALLTTIAVAYGPLGNVVQTPVAHAAVGDACTYTTTTQGAGGSVFVGQGTVLSNGTCSGFSNGVSGTTATDSKGNPVGDGSCSGITSCLAWGVYWIGPGLASWFASSIAYFFDYVVAVSLNSSAYALDFLRISWQMILSLANMFFIFILIYVAFVIMLRAETVRTMQTLAWVIAIALLVNFSFFFTRVVIDAGNILGTQFYNQVVAINQQSGAQAVTGSSGSFMPVDITYNILTALGVQQLMGGANFQSLSNSAGGSWSALITVSVVFLVTAIMFWILAAALLMAGIKFFVRIVGLWLVLIASPLAFLARTLSQTQRAFSMWLQALIGLTFYPAVFLLMFWILNTFVSGMKQSGVGGSTIINGIFNQAESGGTQLSLVGAIANVGIKLGFIVVLMYVILKVTDWMMEQVGGMATTILNRASGAILGGGLGTGRFAAGLAFRGAAATTGALGRNVVGRGANAAARSELVQGWSANNLFGRGLKNVLTKTASSSFDVRNAPGSSLLGKAVSKTIGDVNVGKAGGKGGFIKQMEERQKELKKAAEGMKADAVDIAKEQSAEEKKHDSKYSPGDFARQTAERRKALDDARAGGDKGAIKEAENKLKEFTEAGKKSAEAKQKERLDAFAKRLGTRSWQNLGFIPGPITGPSRSSLRGAADVRKIATGKSAKDELAEAAAKMAKEDEENASAERASPAGETASKDTGGSHRPGAGPSAFTPEAGTEHAIEKFEQQLHRDFKKLYHQQEKTLDRIEHMKPPEASRQNTNKLVNQISGGVAERLREASQIPADTTKLENNKNPATGTERIIEENKKDQNNTNH